MRKLIYWSKGYMLPLFLLAILGFVSCTEQEVNPIEPTDKFSEFPIPVLNEPAYTYFYQGQSYSENE
ncbi:MAG: hypothetical protein ACJAWV_001765 [Flammeovirgaceae bacterium]|jgi:hypothetical protein